MIEHPSEQCHENGHSVIVMLDLHLGNLITCPAMSDRQFLNLEHIYIIEVLMNTQQACIKDGRCSL